MTTYDRYEGYRKNGEVDLIPYANIGERDSDYFEVYYKNKTRLDHVSSDYYGDPNYGWLILLANPEVGCLEYAIPDATTLRIPYPLGAALEAYENALNEYEKYNSDNY